MKIDKIVYLISTPFSKRDNDRFGADIFLGHNIEVIVLDITAYLDKYVAKNYVCDSKINYPYVKHFDNYLEIKRFILHTSPNTIFVSFIGESSVKSLKILNLLSQYKKEFGIILSGSLPLLTNKQNLLNRFKLLSLKNIQRLIGKAVYLVWFNNFYYSFVITSGEMSHEVAQNKYKNSAIIKGHAFDYDLYLDNDRNANMKNKEYAVFLDEFFPFHPDYLMHGIDYSSYATDYYEKLSKFFDYIEKSFEVEVIVSAHPRSYYDKLPDCWKNRKVIKTNTINLVKNSQMCLLHASTSINFAVLYHKPAVFITMKEVATSNIQVLLQAMASELNSIVVNIDDFDDNKILDIKYNKTKYDDYKKKYIKSINSPDVNNWELLYTYYTQKQDKK